MCHKSIHIALSPNNTWKDTMTALAFLVLPWNWFRWKKGPAVAKLEQLFREKFDADYALAVGSGREALLQILSSLKLEQGSEVLLQSFTCMVVTNSIIWSGLKPVYADIDDQFNLDPEDLRKKITPKTKVVIVQHTFGVPGKITEILKICREKNLILIEDCAHSLGATAEGKQVGSFGDLAFFSLGRSKVISCVNGGMVICNNPSFIPGLTDQEKHLKNWGTGVILQNLLHPLIFSLGKLLYSIGLGKALIVASQKLKLVNLEVTPGEKKGHRPARFVSRLANAMAAIALIQMSLLDQFNEQRRRAARYYFQHLKKGIKLNPADLGGAHDGGAGGAIFLRYPLLIKNPAEVRRAAKKQGVMLGDWYSVPVAPADVDQSKTGYQNGQCPHCEIINSRILNLPTHHSLKQRDWQKIVKLVNQYAED